MKVIIIGGVAGGATAAARLRRRDENIEILLIERGEYVSYANCGLPYYIGGTISERDRLFLQSPEGFKERFNTEVRVNSEVTSIDRENKTVTIADSKEGKIYSESYDKLIVSTGAEPFVPAINGINGENIFTLRNVADTDRIKNYIDQHQPRRAVVVGGGFIGLEMVENLHDLGIEVCIIERDKQVMAPLDFSMAAQVHQHLRSKGVGMFLGENVVDLQNQDGATKIMMESGKEVTADIVILSIGVRPETKLAQDAKIELGNLGGIKVNEHMQTSDKDIYALGDVVEVFNPIIKKYALIPLAGPANKQGRIVADNIIDNNQHKYEGSIGTSIAKVFDLTVAAAGASSKLLDRENIEHQTSYSQGNSHAGYYPEALPLSIKINFSPKDGKLFGAQVVGYDGVDKRIEMLAQVIQSGGTIYDLQELEHAYTPPYSSAKDPVNIAGFIAENILTNRMNIIHWNQFLPSSPEHYLLDTRTTSEFEFGAIENSVNIPVDELRGRLSEIPRDKKIIIYCAVGLRGYIAQQILRQNGFENVFNLSGGYSIFAVSTEQQSTPSAYPNSTKPDNQTTNTSPEMDTSTIKTININACGLQCPGPIIQLKKNYDLINEGDKLEIKVTDQAFTEDLKGWTKMVGADILDVDNSGGVITATIQKAKKTVSETSTTITDGKTLVVFSDDLDRALASFVIANGAAASGKKVSMFFTFWGLNVLKRTNQPSVQKDFLGKMFGMMLPSSSKKLKLSQMNMGGMGSKMMRYIMKSKNIDSLESLIEQAKENGVEFIACSMSMDVMGIKKEELIDGITVGGVAAYIERTDNANMNLFI